MTQHTDEEGILTVLLKNFGEHRLPRALDIKEKVDKDEAEKVKGELEEAGASVELK